MSVGPARRMKLLLVEDDPAIQLVARAALSRAGFSVTVAADGEDALARAGGDPPDVVLLDWAMPGLDGAEVCRRLKTNAATAAIPVIFMTARAQPRELDEGLALGAAGYIVKPFDALSLGHEVRGILGLP
jgi:CheY-like chemotaxis protein